jgi:hypothetical protein
METDHAYLEALLGVVITLGHTWGMDCRTTAVNNGPLRTDGIRG